MSEPENFLTRWSRRKRVAEAPAQCAPNLPTQLPGAASAIGSPEGEPVPASATVAAPVPVFDPASLPSLDSIGAQTDIRAFLQAGVPNDLRLAALRRAWIADPAICSFKGLAESDWDFNDPNGMMGFGKLDPNTDVKKMLAQLFGETPGEIERPTEVPAPAERRAPPSLKAEISEPPTLEATSSDIMVQRDKNIATQDKNIKRGKQPCDLDDDHAGEAQIKRHGGALPQ
jgi:hypothetical protein